MQTTDNFDLKLYEGTDKFNPLLVENDNTEVIDGILYEQQGGLVESATELKSGSVHAITRTKGEAPVFRFTATANWTAGDTMTVDGTQVSVFLTNGESLGTGAYVIGTEVLASIVGTRVTVYCVSGTVEEAENALKLGGELPAYYGKAEDVETANSLAQAANTIAQAAQTQVTQLNSDLKKKIPLLSNSSVYVNLNQTVETYTTPEDGLYYLSSAGTHVLEGSWYLDSAKTKPLFGLYIAIVGSATYNGALTMLVGLAKGTTIYGGGVSGTNLVRGYYKL